ncbi:phosphate transport system permease protein [Salirhabdus euzebyi]|uniref:Phosphate transport system permease protein n=1 Tax=Salirhabdus euzebyi TaxID=394506 RepID=A0A841Q7L6_9BACI|nr:phosphate ABC transporter permease subunit PstC [Salirhabdus euzebyi]MBB6454282.1 phosphate transport system permease protein [Salirhabdus euzebyi]
MNISHEGKQGLDIQKKIKEKKEKRKLLKQTEKVVPIFLFLCALFSVIATLGIVFTLLKEAITFFSAVPMKEFFFNNTWSPWSGEFGVIPLISGTLLITCIAIVVALPLGIAAAIFLSEYASDKTRRIIKPTLEVLAGIPTVVYGFFALTFITPLFEKIIPELPIFNALSAGIVVGVMIIPMIASLSEDAMNAVPNSLREGALAMGATRFEVATKVVLPAAFSGVVASIVLAVSRAIGETMIVTIAAGQTPNLTFNPTESIQTLTAFIVQGAKGDTTYGSTIYYSIYAVGITLFVFTLLMNFLSQYIVRKYREEY